jgi:hypothetical protein
VLRAVAYSYFSYFSTLLNQPVSISSYVLLRGNRIVVDGEVVFENQGTSDMDFMNLAYGHFKIDYPKFFKMDRLCQTGFIAAELLLRGKEQGLPEETGIIISSANSSLDTDLRYEASLQTTASPALFVYTLPNILIGELSIKHRLKGESACFVFDIFGAEFQAEYINSLFETGKIKRCVSGWADYYDGTAEAFFYLAEPTVQHPLKHDSTTLNKLFAKHD